MKNRSAFGLLLLSVCFGSVLAAADDKNRDGATFENTLAARDKWRSAVRNYASGVESFEKVKRDVLEAEALWNGLTNLSRARHGHLLNGLWLQTAKAAAGKKEYKNALEAYEREVAFNYQMGLLVRGRTRAFYMDLIILEAQMLGHLGRGNSMKPSMPHTSPKPNSPKLTPKPPKPVAPSTTSSATC